MNTSSLREISRPHKYLEIIETRDRESTVHEDMEEITFNSIAEFHRYNNLAEPENPLFSAFHTVSDPRSFSNNEQETLKDWVKIQCNFYAISFKKIISGEIVYGRTNYDCTNGALLFTAPNQTLIFKNVVFSSEAYHVLFHKDYILNTDLYQKIAQCNFFDYNVNEALHVSPKEESLVRTVLDVIQHEYGNNQDEFSKEIVLTQLETLLTYADRFYKRQFLNRKELNHDLISRFRSILHNYFNHNQLEEEGIPPVDWFSNQLGVSHRYMSDTIKAETGKTAIEQINLFLIEQAKSLLLDPNFSIAETAYKLGFEYPQYFSRLFKKNVGVSPRTFIEQAQAN